MYVTVQKGLLQQMLQEQVDTYLLTAILQYCISLCNWKHVPSVVLGMLVCRSAYITVYVLGVPCIFLWLSHKGNDDYNMNIYAAHISLPVCDWHSGFSINTTVHVLGKYFLYTESHSWYLKHCHMSSFSLLCTYNYTDIKEGSTH